MVLARQNRLFLPLGAVLVLMAALTACSPTSPAPATSQPKTVASAVPTPASTAPLLIGSQLGATDVGHFVAIERGYYRQEGIAAELVPVRNASEMVPLLSTGKIDVAGVSANAALLNALRRGVQLKLVADKGSYKPGFPFQPLLARKDLYDSGRFRKIEDVKGLKIAFTSPGKGTTNAMVMDWYLKKVNMSVDDFEIVSINFPDQAAALANKSVDGALSLEPYATKAVKSGIAVLVAGQEEMYPDYTNAMVIFSERLYANRDLAVRAARAYLRGVKDYNRAVRGQTSQSDRQSINEILSKHTSIDLPTVSEMQPVGLDDNARINKQAIRDSHTWFLQQGFLEGPVTNLDAFFGDDILEEAIRTLGQ